MKDDKRQRRMTNDWKEVMRVPATTWWSVLVEFAAAKEAGLLPTQDERFDLFADAVEEHDGVVGGGGNGYCVRLSVHADDAAMAALHGRDLAWKAARRADLPEWPCVRLEAIAHDELAQELERVALPTLLGAAEVTRLLNVSRQRLAELRAAKLDFPRPIAELAAGPVWLQPAIHAWTAGWERRPGRPRNPETVVSTSTAPSSMVYGFNTSGGKEVMKMAKGGKVYRSAKTGRFVTKTTAKRSPSTTVGETRGKSAKKK